MSLESQAINGEISFLEYHQKRKEKNIRDKIADKLARKEHHNRKVDTVLSHKARYGHKYDKEMDKDREIQSRKRNRTKAIRTDSGYRKAENVTKDLSITEKIG